jgi:uncharacterized Zn ribbon protein
MAKKNFWDDEEENTSLVVKDANGATLQDGDTVIAIKDIKVK